MASRLWLTKSTVRPLRSTSSILPRQRRWNSASPTASTSSTSRMSACHVGGDGEAEAKVHARGVALHRRVHESLEAGEVDDLVQPGAHLAPRHAEDGAVQVGVLEPGELTVEPSADLEQRTDATTSAAPALRRRRDVADDLQQRALAGTVGADDAERGALVDRRTRRCAATTARTAAPRPPRRRRPRRAMRLAEVGPGAVVLAEAVPLADPVELDHRSPSDDVRELALGTPEVDAGRSRNSTSGDDRRTAAGGRRRGDRVPTSPQRSSPRAPVNGLMYSSGRQPRGRAPAGRPRDWRTAGTGERTTTSVDDVAILDEGGAQEQHRAGDRQARATPVRRDADHEPHQGQPVAGRRARRPSRGAMATARSMSPGSRVAAGATIRGNATLVSSSALLSRLAVPACTVDEKYVQTPNPSKAKAK